MRGGNVVLKVFRSVCLKHEGCAGILLFLC